MFLCSSTTSIKFSPSPLFIFSVSHQHGIKSWFSHLGNCSSPNSPIWCETVIFFVGHLQSSDFHKYGWWEFSSVEASRVSCDQRAQIARVYNTIIAYNLWEKQDQLLPSWTFSSITMSKAVVTKVVVCNYSWQVWSLLLIYFAVQSRAKIIQYKSELRNTKEYILWIKALVDALASIGHFVSTKEHV